MANHLTTPSISCPKYNIGIYYTGRNNFLGLIFLMLLWFIAKPPTWDLYFSPQTMKQYFVAFICLGKIFNMSL